MFRHQAARIIYGVVVLFGHHLQEWSSILLRPCLTSTVHFVTVGYKVADCFNSLCRPLYEFQLWTNLPKRMVSFSSSSFRQNVMNFWLMSIDEYHFKMTIIMRHMSIRNFHIVLVESIIMNKLSWLHNFKTVFRLKMMVILQIVVKPVKYVGIILALDCFARLKAIDVD